MAETFNILSKGQISAKMVELIGIDILNKDE